MNTPAKQNTHRHFVSVMDAMNAESLKQLLGAFEGDRRDALARADAKAMRFCEERMALIEAELTKRRAK